MKRALVLSLVALFAFGVASFGQLSGYWSTNISIDPDAAVFGAFITGLGSTLSVDYALSDWTFGSVSSFDRAGYSAQKFSVAGALGAFTLASNMYFDPAAITVWTLGAQQSDSVVCPLTLTATTAAPIFTKWDASADVSIAGVSFGVYVLQNYSYYDVLYVNLLWNETAGAQTDSLALTSGLNGMGMRVKVAGTFGAVNVTSYTYFNLTEAASKTTYGLAIGKRGVFTVGAGCDFVFNEQYVLIEGFTFGCATIDIGLKILCTGFSDITFLVKDVSIGGWATFDFQIKFTTTTKTVSTNITLNALTFDCIELELGFGSGYTGVITTNVISSIYIHGFKLVQTWNGITFTSITELDAASLLMSGTSWTYLYGPDSYGYIVPFVGANYLGVDIDETGDDYWEYLCVPTERYRLWEKFVIDVDADACCGGLFDLTIATYFGEHQVLGYVGYQIDDSDTATLLTAVPLYENGGTAATFTQAATVVLGVDIVNVDTSYVAGPETTLFDWAKTSVDLGVGIGANIALTFGFDVSAFGWDSLDVGFKWSF